MQNNQQDIIKEINNRYLIQKKTNISKIIREHLLELYNEYNLKLKEQNIIGYSRVIKNETFKQKVLKEFKNNVEEEFDNIIIGDITVSMYIQNNEKSINNWHSHVQTSSINATCYINVPKEGGNLELFFDGFVLNVKPIENILYIFPYWASHRPLPQKDRNDRICLNIECMTKERPVKKDGIIW